MTLGSVFSGIGGFDLAAERAGMEIKWQIENDPFCIKVLHKHWPNVKRFKDVKEQRFLKIPEVDVVCGGPPCQPFSVAGKQGGWEDPRNLWNQFLSIVERTKPTWVVAENSIRLIDLGYDKIAAKMESMEYSIGAICIPACAVGANHIRERIWIVAHSNHRNECTDEGAIRKEGRNDSIGSVQSGITSDSTKQRLERSPGEGSNGKGRVCIKPSENIEAGVVANSCLLSTERERLDGFEESRKKIEERLSGCYDSREVWRECEIEPGIRRVDVRISSGLDRYWAKRIGALGNAVVPQIPELIFRCIMEVENENRIHGT